MTEEQLRQWADEVCLPKCQLFFDLVRDVICSGNEEHYAYMVNLLALTVQLSWQPSEVAVVLKGDQGAGKGTFVASSAAGCSAATSCISIAPSSWPASSTPRSQGKVVVFADEAFFAGDKSSSAASSD
jgi:hypothetical protein